MDENEAEKIRELFDLFCASVGKLVSDKINELNLERTVYASVSAAADDSSSADVLLLGSGVRVESLPNCTGKNLSEGDKVVLRYVGSDYSGGYIARVI